MGPLDPAVLSALGTPALVGMWLLIRFFDWIRRGKVEDAETVNTRLAAAVDREAKRADDAEAAEDRMRSALEDERAYVDTLRAQLHGLNVTPATRPARSITRDSEGPRP